VAVKSLKWKQVLAWRVKQQGLSERFKRRQIVEAVRRLGGLQAQVMSAAELGLGMRVDRISPQEVQSALWEKRTLVKTWAMRATLHLIAAKDLSLYAAARSNYETRNWEAFYTYFGVPPKLQQAYLEVAPEVLSDRPLTREEFAAALGERTGSPELYKLISTPGWGTALKPLAWHGDLCFGPSRGQNVTYVHPPKWIGEWEPVEPYPALQEVARRYLCTYGPGTAETFSRWWELRLVPARKLFRSLEDELEPVDVEGWRAFTLKSTLEPLLESRPAGTVNLLPLFDAYVMGIGREWAIEPLIAAAHKFGVYREAGWISAVVLVDGRIEGVWEYENRRNQTLVKVTTFSPLKPAVKKGLEVEAERLGKFLNTVVTLNFAG
jgi:winged helix DNA-binding protein